MSVVFSKLEDGIIIEVDADGDLSGASSLFVQLMTPNKELQDHTGTFTTDGSDGKIQTTKSVSEVTREGVWKARGKYTLNSDVRYTTWFDFRVTE
jgi:hypothetical protein